MIYELQSDQLKVQINSKGGNLWSVQDTEGTQYLWQGDERYWPDKSLNLFPYIARLTEGKYELDQKVYEMSIHGFVKDSDLAAREQKEDRVVLVLEAGQDTKAQYPFDFWYSIEYRVSGKKLDVIYQVENRDQRTMYFGVGGHPGFNVPLEEGLAFEDYHLEFASQAAARQVGMSPDCFVTGESFPFALKDGVRLDLAHTLFDDDAIILQDMSREVSLLSETGRKGVKVTFEDMPYLGLWHAPRTEAPYLCIEPWSSLPSRKGIVEDLAKQENLIALKPGKVYQNRWSIEII